MKTDLCRRLSPVLFLTLCLASGSAVTAQTVSEAIADRVVRFHADPAAASAAHPSMAMLEPNPPTQPAPAEFPIVPVFSSKDGRQIVTIPIQAGTSLYGTGEVTGPLLRNGRVVECWNTDAYGYGDEAPSLYQAHPWVLAVRADGTAFGVLADTTYRCQIDLSSSIVFRADGPAFPVVIIDRPSPQDVVTTLADLTGRMPLPPKWALGYHQCRYSYYPDSRVMEIARGFRDRDIPCDVIWHDIDYMQDFLCFTFHRDHFPDPARHNTDLHALGFKSVWMIDPGIGADPAKFPPRGYSVFESGTAGDHWVKRADRQTVYQGEVWPGWCVFPDFTRASTRSWWAGLYRDFMATGIDGVWNDMNEPAVFNVSSKTMPEDNWHRADDALGGPGPHARFHNVYGMLMVRASREGIQAARPDLRPFVLSRANYIGGQRYAATWTGDNSADWYHLEASIPMVLNLGLSGQPFTGPDIGGFAGNGDGALFARWMGFGALLPFARGHTGKENIDKEPWSFGPAVEQTSRLAIQLRYRLLPYIYTLFEEASRTGLPVARPLFFFDPRDPALRSEDDAFLLGADLLVAAQMMPDRTRTPVLPRGIWRPFTLVDRDDDLPALYLRGGAILPVGPVMQYTDEKPLDPLTLVVALDEAGRAEGALYEDAGDGYGYQRGEFRRTRITATLQDNVVLVRIRPEQGAWTWPVERRITVRVLLEGREVATPAPVAGNEIRLPIR